MQGLNIGADDYITKPFSPRQLVARAQAIMRRARQAPTSPLRQVGNLIFNPSQRELVINQGDPISLTPLENRLLDYLMLNAGQVSRTDAIIDHVWGPAGGDRDMLRQLVRRLRNKIESDPANPTIIMTIPGLGYGITEYKGEV